MCFLSNYPTQMKCYEQLFFNFVRKDHMLFPQRLHMLQYDWKLIDEMDTLLKQVHFRLKVMLHHWKLYKQYFVFITMVIKHKHTFLYFSHKSDNNIFITVTLVWGKFSYVYKVKCTVNADMCELSTSISICTKYVFKIF